MNLSVSHVGTGGAWRVAKSYASALGGVALARPSLIALARNVAKLETGDLVIFHSPTFALRSIWLIKLMRPRNKVYWVEHFIPSQLLRNEFPVHCKRIVLYLSVVLLRAMGATPIALDAMCARNHRRIFGDKGHIAVVHNPVEIDVAKRPDPAYDIIWAAGFSNQKKWPDALYVMREWKREKPHLRIAVASYSDATPADIQNMKDAGIDFLGNRADWNRYARCLFFSSDYEGFPLALIEAAAAGILVCAWTPRSCYDQILRNYAGSIWRSNRMAAPTAREICDILSLNKAAPLLELRHTFLHFQQAVEKL